MQYTTYADPIIYLALLLINIADIFVFYLVIKDLTEGKKRKKGKRRKAKSLNTPNSWWAILMVMVLALVASMQNNIQTWSILLIIPMVNLVIATFIHFFNNRFKHLRKIGFSRA